MIKGVIFDMDGLMFDTESLTVAAFQRGMLKEGLDPLPDHAFAHLFGRKLSEVVAFFETATHDHAAAERITAERERYIEQALAGGFFNQKPGLVALLDYLRAEGLPHIVASSSPRWQIERNLKATHIDGYFEQIFSSEQVARAKPAPDVFLGAAAAMGVSPGNCLVLEDSINGIQAAAAGGMIPVMIPDLRQPDAETRGMAAAVFNNLEQVIPWIALQNKEKHQQEELDGAQ
ncbi:HAD family hydrolase [Pseudoramibacter alactolyticus]